MCFDLWNLDLLKTPPQKKTERPWRKAENRKSPQAKPGNEVIHVLMSPRIPILQPKMPSHWQSKGYANRCSVFPFLFVLKIWTFRDVGHGSSGLRHGFCFKITRDSPQISFEVGKELTVSEGIKQSSVYWASFRSPVKLFGQTITVLLLRRVHVKSGARRKTQEALHIKRLFHCSPNKKT